MFLILSKTKMIILATLYLSSTNAFNLDWCTILLFGYKLMKVKVTRKQLSKMIINTSCQNLTHYQTTYFRLFQTERVCRWQFWIWRKWKKVIQTSRKHCGKRRNCSLSLFPRGVKRCHCVGMGQFIFNVKLTLYQTTKFWTCPKWKQKQTRK